MDKVRKYKSLYSSICNTFAIGEGETITPASVTGLPQDTEITLTFDRVDSAGNKTPAKMERIRGKIVGGNFVISQGGRGADGTTEQVHTAPVVEMIWNASDWNDTVDHILTEHNQDGTHKDTLVTSLKATGAEINTGTEDAKIVTPKAIADSKVSLSDKTETLTNKTLTSPLFQGSVDGWISANVSWTRESDNSFSEPIDATLKYQKGDKLRYKQGGAYKYQYVISVGAYSGGKTIITTTGGTDYKFDSGTAITDNYYSHQDNPIGFPAYINLSTYNRLHISGGLATVTGWGYVTGNGNSQRLGIIYHGITYSVAPIVTVSLIGYKDSATAPTAITEFNLPNTYQVGTSEINTYETTTTSFRYEINVGVPANWTTSVHLGFLFIVSGKL